MILTRARMCGRIRFVFFAALLVTVLPDLAIAQAPGIFEGQTEVGASKFPGQASFEPNRQEYIVSGSGSNIWGTHDQFHFLWRKIKGDFILRTQGRLLGKGTELHRKLGWMLRTSLDSDAVQINGVVHGDGRSSVQFRRKRGATTEELLSAVKAADEIQLERRGQNITISFANFGEPFQSISQELDLGEEVYAGLFVCSHHEGILEKALFSNVRIIKPAPESLVAYKQFLGSAVEVLDVTDGNCRIVYQSTKSIQAPNWLKTNNRLLYNRQGLLYTLDPVTGTAAVLHTGAARDNNNDHVISFDGRRLAISNQSGDNRCSVGFVLPIGGGEPKAITGNENHSYMHGWSPDGKYLLFTGMRNKDFDVYRIPASGGQEVQLTHSPGLDDGAEYTPDGKYIYFNSVRSGLMQIWRMLPDGSSQEQVTHDEFNNWFPHVSPDGKWIVFISFLKSEVAPGDHPFYKHVYLRLMPAGGGMVKTVAYVYGGQGTINTPSWSPDSRHLAFVSNSDLLFPAYPSETTKP